MMLTEEQSTAMNRLLDGYRFNTLQTLGGIAGTGKSSTLSEMVKVIAKPIVVSFTGKAASVLRSKGVEANTIHSTIYNCQKTSGGSRFKLKKFLDGDVIIIDEASMIGEAILKDLSSFRIPIIAIGDHGQLPPIGKDAKLMENPDIKLETIHRNAGPIAWFANHLRQGLPSRTFVHNGPEIQVYESGRIGMKEKERMMMEADQIICAYNFTRVGINRAIRNRLGRTTDMPVTGDRVMCLRNNQDFGLFNGMQGVLKDVSRNRHFIFESDCGHCVSVDFHHAYWNNPKPPEFNRKDRRIPFDYCWSVTAHKFQGSEADNVLVIEENSSMWDMTRWRYTAASRAKKNLNWVVK